VSALSPFTARLSPRAQAWVLGCAGAVVALAVWTLLAQWLATGDSR